MPMRAVCSTRRRGAIVSLKSSDGILRELGRRVEDVVINFFDFGCEGEWEVCARGARGAHLAASSRMRHWPPVPFVPWEEGRSTISRTELSRRSVSLSCCRDDDECDDDECDDEKKDKNKSTLDDELSARLRGSFYKIGRFDASVCQKLPRVHTNFRTPQKTKTITDSTRVFTTRLDLDLDPDLELDFDVLFDY